jgi:ABC-type dipeptide/oligopeptide/nickel transport system permease component
MESVNDCIRRAFVEAFGIAIAVVLMGLLLSAITGFISGGPAGSAALIASTIGPILGFALASFVLAAALFIFECLARQSSSTAGAGNTGGASQGLVEDEGTAPRPICHFCERVRPFGIAALLAGLIIVLHHK